MSTSDSATYHLPLPTFLIIGAQKSATRWLRVNLGRHPQVFTAEQECQYFSNDLFFPGNTIRRYRRQFEGWNGEPYVGEATPGYMMWRHDPDIVAGRIWDVLPDVRLLAILRNPIDRAQSALLHHIRRGRVSAEARLVDIVRATQPERHRLGFVAGGWYGASLQPFHKRFGDQLLIQLHDDIEADALGLYHEAARHIGASTDFVPPELDQVRFSNQRKVKGDQEPLTAEERCELFEYFRADIADLETLAGRDLSRWDPTISATTATR